MGDKLNLRAVLPDLRSQAQAAFDEGDASALVYIAADRLGFVADNVAVLKRRGIYEKSLLTAFTDVRTNFVHWPEAVISLLFRLAKPEKLRQAGDPIPVETSFCVYRGIAGHGRARRLRGYSWTLSLDVACWFATRFKLANPAILTAEVANSDVLAYLSDRSEKEILCHPTLFKRVNLALEEIHERAERQAASLSSS